jgi:hypothetical protein
MDDWMRCGSEPGLDEILGDPIVVALMHRDGVTERHVREVVMRARGRRGPARFGHGALPAPVPTSSF